MKRRVNLFARREQTSQLTLRFSQVLKGGLIGGAIMVLVLTLFIGGFFILNDQFGSAQNSLSQIKRYILLNQGFSQQIREFNFKHSALQSFLEQDAEGYLYYDLLKGLFEKTQAREQLIEFSIDNSQKVSFSVQFENYEDALLFIQEIEAPSFTEPFQSLSIGSFSVMNSGDSLYELTLDGVFIPIHATRSQAN